MVADNAVEADNRVEKVQRTEGGSRTEPNCMDRIDKPFSKTI